MLDKQVFADGSVFDFQNAMRYLLSHLNTEYIIGGGAREEKLEMPEAALREALLNAISHRDYRLSDHIQVNIFQDRVEVINPGGLVAGLQEKDLGRVSRPRNPLLFSILERMDLVENIGSGIKRMRDSMKEYGLSEPVIEISDTWFSIAFPRLVPLSAEQGGALNGALNEGSKYLLEAIQKKPGIQRKELVEKLGIPDRTVDRYVAELISDGKIERRGSKKTCGYRAL